MFRSKPNLALNKFIGEKLPHDQLFAMTDSNWGPQDSSIPSPSTTDKVPLHISQSQAGFIFFLYGPLTWNSHRNKTTARSSADAEIHSVNSCTKEFQYINNVIDELHIHQLIPCPTNIYNDNTGCVYWSGNMTNRNLRHLQICENAVREQVQLKYINILHCEGTKNIADIFTKENKDKQHYLKMRDVIVCDPIPLLKSQSSSLARGVLAHDGF